MKHIIPYLKRTHERIAREEYSLVKMIMSKEDNILDSVSVEPCHQKAKKKVFFMDDNNNDNLFLRLLKKHFYIEIDDDNPDFLFTSASGKAFAFTKYDCPRIMITGEPFSPDFTAIDYFIGFDNIAFGDRAFRFPLFLYNPLVGYTNAIAPTKDSIAEEIKMKTRFCNFIYGHQTTTGVREAILNAVSGYKRVDCAGTFLNNMPDGAVYSYAKKRDFMKEFKFSIASESMAYPGFTTEKLYDAFYAHTIPIYWGNPEVEKEFNSRAFINCNNKSLDAVLNEIIQVDNDQDMFIEMLCENRYVVKDYESMMLKKLEDYLVHIVEQDKDIAYRRPRYYLAGNYEKRLKYCRRILQSPVHKVIKKLTVK